MMKQMQMTMTVTMTDRAWLHRLITKSAKKYREWKETFALLFLWSNLGVKVMVFVLCTKPMNTGLFVFRTWWIGMTWNNLNFMALRCFKLFRDLNKNYFKGCILICNGHKFFFFETENYCPSFWLLAMPCLSIGYHVQLLSMMYEMKKAH